MTLKIEINLTNAAFDGANRNLETARILRELADDLVLDSAGVRLTLQCKGNSACCLTLTATGLVPLNC